MTENRPFANDYMGLRRQIETSQRLAAVSRK